MDSPHPGINPGTNPGTRPIGVPEAETARHVRSMFDRIADRYDLANHLLSMQVDRYWRRRTVQLLRQHVDISNPRVLDVCCGTGDLSLELAAQWQHARGGARIYGADFSRAMLRRARGKAPALSWIESDAMRLPCADEAFAAVATAFGFRNLSDYRLALREFCRVLQPGGALAILEFSQVTLPVLGLLYRAYLHHVLPRLGGLISGNSDAYRYLPNSVSHFPSPTELADWMREAGFNEVEVHPFTGGIAVLHIGIRGTA